MRNLKKYIFLNIKISNPFKKTRHIIILEAVSLLVSLIIANDRLSQGSPLKHGTISNIMAAVLAFYICIVSFADILKKIKLFNLLRSSRKNYYISSIVYIIMSSVIFGLTEGCIYFYENKLYSKEINLKVFISITLFYTLFFIMVSALSMGTGLMHFRCDISYVLFSFELLFNYAAGIATIYIIQRFSLELSKGFFVLMLIASVLFIYYGWLNLKKLDIG